MFTFAADAVCYYSKLTPCLPAVMINLGYCAFPQLMQLAQQQSHALLTTLLL